MEESMPCDARAVVYTTISASQHKHCRHVVDYNMAGWLTSDGAVLTGRWWRLLSHLAGPNLPQLQPAAAQDS
jgi:hypothetical protein